MKKIITNVILVDPEKDICEKGNIYIQDGKICAPFDEADGEIYDGGGLYAAPAFTDMHCHLREPGQTHKETIATGTAAAKAGGFCAVACMPNTNPSIDCEIVLNSVKKSVESVGNCKVFPIVAITEGLASRKLTDMPALAKLGAIAFSDDGKPVAQSDMLMDAMKIAAENNLLMISHCEDMSLIGGCINEGAVSAQLGVKGLTGACEEICIARDILLAKETGVRLHIAHVSTAYGVELIRMAKRLGVNVTAETCPHYFSLDESAVLQYGTNAKMNPPLRTENDVDAIKQGLCDGTIDVIATDHAPHTEQEKSQPLEKAPFGISGLETAFSLCITNLYKTGAMTLPQIIKKLSLTPASILGTNSGSLRIGADADIVLFDPDEQYTANKNEFKSMGKNTPFHGVTLFGKVKKTFINGQE